MAEVIHRYVRDPDAAREKALDRQEVRELDKQYRHERNQQLKTKNDRDRMVLAQARGELIEKRVATLQAGYLLSAFKLRVLQEPADLARRLVQSGVIEAKRRLEVETLVKDDLSSMLDELSELPSKAVDSDLFEEVRRDHLDVQNDGDTLSETTVPEASDSVSNLSEIRAERAKRRRRKMRKLRAQKSASKELSSP